MVVEAKREIDFEHLREIDSKLRTDFLVSSVVRLKEQNPRDVEVCCFTEQGMQALNAGLHRSLTHPSPMSFRSFNGTPQDIFFVIVRVSGFIYVLPEQLYHFVRLWIPASFFR